MERSLRWLAWIIACGFFVLTLWTGYWSVLAGPSLSGHPRNARLHRQDAVVVRGGIYDRNGQPIVTRGLPADRTFVGDPSFAHVVGYTDPRYGQAGLERAYHRTLMGLDEQSALSRFVATLAGTGWAGNDLLTTLDSRIQGAAARALGEQPGAVVVLDPHDGAILAMVSSPGFDPRRLDEALAAREGGRDPLFNRAAQGQYPPGSSFKPVVLAAALETGVVTTADVFTDPGWVLLGGRRIENSEGRAHGPIALDEALALSSNTVFARLAVELGAARLVEAAQRLGLGERPSLPIPAAGGYLPTPQALGDAAAVAAIGIGQDALLVTPLQMAVVAAAVANGGWRVAPYLVQGVRLPDGQVLAAERRRPARAMAPGVAHFVREAMRLAVQQGTARQAAMAGVDVAGKTGTAQVGAGRSPHAWFIGFAPARAPEVVVAVVVEHGGYGGSVAAPIARRVIAAALGLAEGG